MTIGNVRQGLNQATFNPRDLFIGGADGYWFDPSDLGTMFTNTAGTTPVGANNDPVGLIIDKSGRGHNAIRVGTDTWRPTWVASTDGRPYLAFVTSDATDGQGFTTGATGGLGISRNKGYMTIVIGLNITTYSRGWGQNAVFFSTGGSTITRVNIGENNAGAINIGARRLDADSSSSIVLSPTPTAGSNFVAIGEWNFASQYGNAITGTGQAANYGTFPSTTAGTTSDTDSLAACIGCAVHSGGANGGNSAISGRIYGVIAVSRLLEQGEKLQALRWMSMKTIGRYN